MNSKYLALIVVVVIVAAGAVYYQQHTHTASLDLPGGKSISMTTHD